MFSAVKTWVSCNILDWHPTNSIQALPDGKWIRVWCMKCRSIVGGPVGRDVR